MAANRDRHPHRKWIAIVAILATGILVAAYLLVLHSFDSSISARRPFVTGTNAADAIDVKAHVIAVDAGKNEMTVRLVFTPTGAYANGVQALTQAMDLLINGTTSNSTMSFPKGSFMSPTNVTLALDGTAKAYPFDKYSVEFDIFFYAHDAQTTNQPVLIAPTQLSTTAAIHGYSIGLRDVSTKPGFNNIKFDVRRSSSTLFFAIFVMVFMWSLALVGAGMALMMLLLRRDIGPGPLGYLAALLFAFPAIRNALPDTPGIGTRFDFLAFFWAEAVVAVTLITLAILWIIRETRSDGISPEVKAINRLSGELAAAGLLRARGDADSTDSDPHTSDSPQPGPSP